MANIESQIPSQGPLSVLAEAAWTGVCDNLRYGGRLHLRKCYRIPIDLLHFNIHNGRYRTKHLLLQKANPDATIDPTQDRWKAEILKLLNGTWEDSNYPVGTRKDRPAFLHLAEDIRERGQERPGIVLETGGVMSGNRRLAALMHLYEEQQNERFRFFEAFIVPSEGGATSADIWHLEMTAQYAPARLTRGYEAVEKLLKIREGVQCFEDLNPSGGRASAIRAVATDFGVDDDDIASELSILLEIENYLDAIGRPQEWWLAEGLTEVFTEIPPLWQSCETNAMAFEDRSKLKRAIYYLIQNDKADYRLLRDIRTTIGPTIRRRDSRRMPEVTRILIDNAPSTATLQQGSTQTASTDAGAIVDRFKSDLEAGKEQEAPIAKAERAESNLRKLVDVLQRQRLEYGPQVVRVADSLTQSRSLVDIALGLLEQIDS